MQTQPHPPTSLELLASAFTQWRAQRASKQEPIPDRLWLQIERLRGHYPRHKLCQAARLSGSQFSKRFPCRQRPQRKTAATRQQNLTTPPLSERVDFLPVIPAPTPPEQPKATLSLPNGTTLSVFDEQTLKQLLPLLFTSAKVL